MTGALALGAREAPAPLAEGLRLVALLEIAGARVAVPAELVDKAIEAPEAAGPALPGEPAMMGAFVDAGLAYPLVDLGRCLGLPAAGAGGRGTVVLLGAGGRRVAVAVDRVESVRALPGADVVRLSAGGGGGAFGLATLADRAEPAIVLEEGDLLSAPGMVFADAPAAAMAARRVAGGRRDGGRSFLSFSRAGVVYGVEVVQVCEIVIDAEPVAMALPMPGFLGTIDARRGETMLLDRPAPGSGEPPGRGAPRHAVVLEAEGLRFAVPADAVHAISRPSPDEAMALPSSAGDARRLLTGLAPSPVGAAPQILIDAAAVLAAPGIRPLVEKQNHHARAGREAAGQDAAGPLRPFIELRAGGTFFVALEDVRELATLPRSSVVLSRAREGVDGYARHRGETIAVIDLLARLHAEAAPADEASLAIVETDGGPVGFVVEGFASIGHFRVVETTRSARRGARPEDRAGAVHGRHWRLMDATSRQGTRVLAVLDLLGLAREAGEPPGQEERPDTGG